MKTQAKAVTIILTTLIVGLVGGAMITGALFRERLEYIRSFSKVEGFEVRYSEMIGSLSDQQRAEVELLLRAAGEEIEMTFNSTGHKVYAIVEQLEQDLIPYLSDEQIARLRKRRTEIREYYIGRFTIVTEEQFPVDGGLKDEE